MNQKITRFLVHWIATSLAFWASSHLFSGISFANTESLLTAALALGFANALVRPLLILLTFPLTVLSLGLFLLVVNALMLLLVSALVEGFSIAGFWTAFFAGIFVSVSSFLIAAVLGGGVQIRTGRR